jgi:hypothetical protein
MAQDPIVSIVQKTTGAQQELTSTFVLVPDCHPCLATKRSSVHVDLVGIVPPVYVHHVHSTTTAKTIPQLHLLRVQRTISLQVLHPLLSMIANVRQVLLVPRILLVRHVHPDHIVWAAPQPHLVSPVRPPILVRMRQPIAIVYPLGIMGQTVHVLHVLLAVTVMVVLPSPARAVRVHPHLVQVMHHHAVASRDTLVRMESINALHVQLAPSASVVHTRPHAAPVLLPMLELMKLPIASALSVILDRTEETLVRLVQPVENVWVEQAMRRVLPTSSV